MTSYLIGVDGGGTGTRVRLARADGSEVGQGRGGPSGLAHGIDHAWAAIDAAIDAAFAGAALPRPAPAELALGCGLAGVHNRDWAGRFSAANPGFGALRVETDGYTTLLGAHAGAPGCIVAIGTGSVGEALLPDGQRREVGGWGFPAGDEGSGAWLGLQAANHLEQVLDGRQPPSPFAHALGAVCGTGRDAVQAWLAGATQTTYAALAPLVLEHGASAPAARALLEEAGRQVERIARALDPAGTLPLALCGGLGAPLQAWLPAALRARCRAPQGDAASGALRMIATHLER